MSTVLLLLSGVFVVLAVADTVAPVSPSPNQTTSTPESIQYLPSELMDCTEVTYPCFAARYVDLVLDSVRESDLVVPKYPSATAKYSASTTVPLARGGGGDRSLWRAASMSDQSTMPFIINLCHSDNPVHQSSGANPIKKGSPSAVYNLSKMVYRMSTTFAAYQKLYRSKMLRIFASSGSNWTVVATPAPVLMTPTPSTSVPVTAVPRSTTSVPSASNGTTTSAVNVSTTSVPINTTKAPLLSTTTGAPTATGAPTTVASTTRSPILATTSQAPLPTATTSPQLTLSPSATPQFLDITAPICSPISSAVASTPIASLDPQLVASLAAVPGVRLLPFRSSGDIVVPYKGGQYLVSMLVVSTGRQTRSLLNAILNTDTSDLVAANSPAQIAQRRNISYVAANTSSTFAYRLCGVVEGYVLNSMSYAQLFLTPTTSPDFLAMYAPVGFGAPNSSNLSTQWILLLAGGTLLVFGAAYAVCVRRFADGSKAEQVERNEVSKAEDDNEAQDSDDEEELQATEAQGAIEQNLKSVWNERDLHEELDALVARKQALHSQNAVEDGGQAEVRSLYGEEGRRFQTQRRGGARATQAPGGSAAKDVRGFVRVELLPQSSKFEESFETCLQYSLPPEHDEDDTAFERRLKRMQARDEVRRKREEENAAMLFGDAADDNRVEVLNANVANGGAAMADGADEDDDLMVEMPPAIVDADRSHSNGGSDDEGGKPAEEEKGATVSKPIGLAARRMASMMSNMKFAAVPFGAMRLPAQHELNAQLSGGTAASHLAMAGERNETAERLSRARFSKLYFAPQSFVDKAAGLDDSDSEGGSAAGSPVAPDPFLRFQEITKRMGEQSPSPSASKGRIDNKASPPSNKAPSIATPRQPAPSLPIREEIADL